MRGNIKTHFLCIFPAAKKWWRDKHADDAAALAFYSLISLVPLLIISVWIASLVVDAETVKRVIIDETGRVAGSSIGRYIAQVLESDIKLSGSSFSPFVGVALFVFSSTKMLSELRESLAKVFGKPEQKKKIYSGLLSKVVAFSIVFILGGVVLLTLTIETVVNLLISSIPEKSSAQYLFSYLTPLTTFLGVILLAALTMRCLPANRPRMQEAFSGGIVCAILMFFLKFGVTTTLKYSEMGSYYGSAFTLVLFLFWVYFAMQIFLYSAEYTAELSSRTQKKRK